MAKYPDSVNKYNHTPRKVFDAYTTKMDRKFSALDKEQRVMLSRMRKLIIDLENMEEVLDDLDLRISLRQQKENQS